MCGVDLISVLRGYAEIFLKAQTAVVYGSCLFNTDIAYMPRFIFVAGDVVLAFRIADDKAVLVAVVFQPDSLGSSGEAVVDDVAVNGKACLMLRVTGTGRICVSLSLTILCNVFIVYLSLGTKPFVSSQSTMSAAK